MSFFECQNEVMNNQKEQQSSSSGSLKRKSERHCTPSKKSKILTKTMTSPIQENILEETAQDEVTIMKEKLLKVKLVDLKVWVKENMDKDLTEEEALLDFCEILLPSQENQYSLLVTILIICILCPSKVLETVMNRSYGWPRIFNKCGRTI